ncbi:MAG: SLBB domain-containing protein [Marinoscillum sp.]
MIKNILVLLLILIPYISNSQSLEDVNSQATSMGITTQSDILKELASRGMTVDDARRMALIYGLDYDEYISQYITKTPATTTGMTTLPTVSELTFLPDTIQEILKDSLQEDIIKSLNYFGYDIFINNPFGNKEYLVGNIDEGYILAPGDVLRIYVFGDNTYQAEVKIDLNGNILLPDIGMFFASGYTFSSLKNRLNAFLGKSFSGLIDSPKRSFLDVSLTQLRPVKITVLGESNAPGPHLISGFATVLNALYASGGIKTSGSLRDIQVFRNNKLRKTIDLYDYITRGSLDGDIRLMNNDIIFIPIRVNTVELSGTVKNPSIYELKDNEGINNLLDYSGGLNANSSSLAVIERIKPISERSVNNVYNKFLTSFDISKSFTSKKTIYAVKKGEYLYVIAKKFNVSVSELKKWNNLSSNHLSINQKIKILHNDFILLDGDKVTFNPIPDKILNSVSVVGSVNQPGFYPLDNYSDLKKLIVEAAQNILPRTYLGKVDVSKENLDGSRSFNTYNLEMILGDSVNVTLEDQDEVRVFSLDEIEGDDGISLSGFGVTDSVFSVWRENLNLYDVVFSSTQFNNQDFQSDFLRTRVDVKRFDKSSGLYSIIPLDMDDDRDFLLLPKDEIVLYSKDVTENLTPTYQITGFVNTPGTYRLDTILTVEDALLNANGLAEFADVNRVAVYSLDYTSPLRSSTLKYVTLDLDYINGKTDKPKKINIVKSFDRISLYRDPNIKDVVTVTVNGEVNSPGTVTQENFVESMLEVLRKAGGLTSFASLESSYIIRDGELINYNFNNLNKAFLRDGDIINISGKYEEITVTGAVNNPSKSIYETNYSVRKYVRLSGGKLSTTQGKPYVIYPSGKAMRVGFLRNPKVYPGCEIFVPFEEKVPLSDRFAEAFTRSLDKIVMFSTLATTTLTTIFLVKNLRDKDDENP